MNEQDRGLELKVGIFVAVGLAILAALVVQFGRLGEGFKSYYSLTVHFPDASGLAQKLRRPDGRRESRAGGGRAAPRRRSAGASRCR